MQFTFGDKREVYLLDESVLPVTEKEWRREGKRSIGPRIKYGHTNLKQTLGFHCSIRHVKDIQNITTNEQWVLSRLRSIAEEYLDTPMLF